MNRHSSVRDMTMKRSYGGGGSSMAWRCMGCDTYKSQLGSQGRGLFKRCASCVAAKEQK